MIHICFFYIYIVYENFLGTTLYQSTERNAHTHGQKRSRVDKAVNIKGSGIVCKIDTNPNETAQIVVRRLYLIKKFNISVEIM